MKDKSLGRQLIERLVMEYPHAGNMTIAKMACKEQPLFYPDIEAARTIVRTHRGVSGNIASRQRATLPPPIPFPKGKVRIGGWSPYIVKAPCNALILADLHVPYHFDDGIYTAIECGQKAGVDTIILNGDAFDCHTISKWETDPREKDFQAEVNAVRSLLHLLRKRFPKGKIIYKLGNHEERYASFMMRKAPELLHVDLFAFDTLLDMDALDIDMVDDKRPIRLGELNIIHGHEYRFAISNPVNPARGLFLKGIAYAMCGHFHQSSYHTEKTIEDKMIATWSIGCLCDLHPQYMPMNKWVHGFAIVEVDSAGKFNVQNKVIRNGRVY